MSASIHLSLSGNHNAASQSLTDLSNISFSKLNHNDHAHLRRNELVELFEETKSEVVGAVDIQRFGDHSQLNQLNNLDLSADQSEILLLPFNNSELFIQSFECLPPVAASLAINPLQHAVVLFPKSALLSLQDIPDSEDLLWEDLLWHM